MIVYKIDIFTIFEYDYYKMYFLTLIKTFIAT